MNVGLGLPLSLLSAALTVALPGQTAFARVGVASVVEGEPVGLPPGGTQRILRVGIDMNADEKVTTKADDRAHLVFLDGTSLTIGPNSEVVIDKYVYSPETKAGDMALKVQRGTLRFVGGIISKSSEVRVDTPSASMGIRGGIFTVSVTALGSTTANFLYGQSFSITSQGVTQSTNTPNTRFLVTPGSPPTPPSPIPLGNLQNSFGSFEGSRSSAGGQSQGSNNNIRGPGPAARSGGSQSAGGNQGLAIGSAVTYAGLRQVNSGLAPPTALANTPTHQQIVAILTQSAIPSGGSPGNQLGLGAPPNTQQDNQQPGAGPSQAFGLQQGVGSFPSGGPAPGGGPLQGAGPLQTLGPLLSNGPLPSDNPLQGSTPLQGIGPQVSGPLQFARPLQGNNPLLVGSPVGFGVPPTQLATLPLDMPIGPPPTPLPAAPDPGFPTVQPPAPSTPSPSPPLPTTTDAPATPPDNPPQTVCVTCFTSPPPPTPTPPPNNIVNCANLTCN